MASPNVVFVAACVLVVMLTAWRIRDLAQVRREREMSRAVRQRQTDPQYLEYKIRLDAALDAITLASARLKDVIFIGPDEAVDAALANLRLARFRFLEARANYREVTELTA